MPHKRLLFACLSAALAPAASFAAECADTGDSPFTIEASAGYESQYVSRALQTGAAIFTPAATAHYKEWHAGFWAALPLTEKNDWPKELDLSAGREFALSEKLTLDLGLTHYSYDKVFAEILGHDSSNEFYAELSLNAPLSPSLTFSRDCDCRTDLAELNLSHEIPLGAGFALVLAGTLGTSFGENSENPDYSYWGATADLTCQLGEHYVLSLGGRYSGATRDFYASNLGSDPDKNHAVWWGTSLRAEY